MNPASTTFGRKRRKKVVGHCQRASPGRAIFTSGRIPRGRGKSPEAAVPSDGITEAELLTMLEESERLLDASRTLSPDHWYRHFAFGVLDRDRTLKFLRIHNRHHLRIVRDILRA